MNIWLDADALPVVIRDIVFRAAQRLAIPVCLVANRPLRVPSSPLIRAVCVENALDAADDYIVQHTAPGDLVITSDVPLAARTIDLGATALSPRGEPFTAANIAERLSVRNFFDDMRAFAAVSGGPPPFSNQDKHCFASALDRLLARRAR